MKDNKKKTKFQIENRNDNIMRHYHSSKDNQKDAQKEVSQKEIIKKEIIESSSVEHENQEALLRETELERKRRKAQRKRERQIERRINMIFSGFVGAACFMGGILFWDSGMGVHKEVVYATGEEIFAEDFRKDAYMEIEFAEGYDAIDTSIPGTYSVVLKSGAFTYTCKAIVEDTIAPVIIGAKDITVNVGETISYKSGVSVTDNFDQKVSFQVDNSQVNLQEAGTYPVTYYAEDAAGNKTSVTVQLELTVGTYTEYAVNLLAKEVLNEIITEEMSQREKLEAIYTWTRETIDYTGNSDKSDWIRGAYDGFEQRKGDCYTYACVAKALLNNAGIENKDIEKIPAKTRHYWNLVNIGEGWYHFDTTPRKGQTISFCYISDADLMEYSNANDKSHNYDKSVYKNIE